LSRDASEHGTHIKLVEFGETNDCVHVNSLFSLQGAQ
jgi:hypothetical protein